MSATAETAAHDAHGDAAHGAHGASAEHHPHVLPLPMYFGVWIMLMVFTALTVAVSYFDFGALNLVIALAVATCKAAMVSLIFMHLFWDRKFHAIVFTSSLIFLAIFIGITMSDTEGRGRADAIEAEHPADIDTPFAATRHDEELKRMYEKKAAGEAPLKGEAPGGEGTSGKPAGEGQAPAPAAPAAPGPAEAPAAH